MQRTATLALSGFGALHLYLTLVLYAYRRFAANAAGRLLLKFIHDVPEKATILSLGPGAVVVVQLDNCPNQIS